MRSEWDGGTTARLPDVLCSDAAATHDMGYPRAVLGTCMWVTLRSQVQLAGNNHPSALPWHKGGHPSVPPTSCNSCAAHRWTFQPWARQDTPFWLAISCSIAFFSSGTVTEQTHFNVQKVKPFKSHQERFLVLLAKPFALQVTLNTG